MGRFRAISISMMRLGVGIIRGSSIGSWIIPSACSGLACYLLDGPCVWGRGGDLRMSMAAVPIVASGLRGLGLLCVGIWGFVMVFLLCGGVLAGWEFSDLF